MSYIDELIRVTSEPIRLQPRTMSAPFSLPEPRPVVIASLPLTAAVELYPWEAGCFSLRPVVGSSEPEDAERWDLRLQACCEVAEALMGSFGGAWWRLLDAQGNPLMELVYRPRPGSDLHDVERGAVAAFAVRGMRASRQTRVTR